MAEGRVGLGGERPRIFVGVDPGNTDTQMLIEVWVDGATIAYRDTSEGSWGPPHDLEERTEKQGG